MTQNPANKRKNCQWLKKNPINVNQNPGVPSDSAPEPDYQDSDNLVENSEEGVICIFCENRIPKMSEAKNG